MTIEDWKPATGSGRRLGAFDLTMPSGMIIRGCSLVSGDQGKSDFVGLPQQTWTDRNGEKKYSPIIEFTDKSIREKFNVAVLQALSDARCR